MVNTERLVKTFIELVEIDSVSYKEMAIKEYLKKLFENKGYQTIEDNAGVLINGECGNLLIKIPGEKNLKPILFCAHMDTVQPGIGIKAIVENGIIRSEGNTILGSDDKAAIAALIEAIYVLKENNIKHPPIEILFTVCEEQGLLGAKAFDFSLLDAEIGYTLDAGGQPGMIIIKSPCQNEIEYRVFGKAAHAGIDPERGINAILLASLALAKIPIGRIDSETTCNIGLIEGGTARNIVADFCVVKGEARSLSRYKLNKITEELINIFKSEVIKNGGTVEVDVKFLYSEIQLDKDEDVVQLAVKAFEKLNIIPELSSTGGGSDASIINANKIRCANLGIGMNRVHTTDEFIRIDDLIMDVKMILAILEESHNFLVKN